MVVGNRKALPKRGRVCPLQHVPLYQPGPGSFYSLPYRVPGSLHMSSQLHISKIRVDQLFPISLSASKN